MLLKTIYILMAMLCRARINVNMVASNKRIKMTNLVQVNL
jgi:hypothetical protein